MLVVRPNDILAILGIGRCGYRHRESGLILIWISPAQITERQSVGLAYLPGQVIRIKVKAVGSLATSHLESHRSSYLTEDTPSRTSAEAPPSKQSCDEGSGQSGTTRHDAPQTTAKRSDIDSTDEKGKCSTVIPLRL